MGGRPEQVSVGIRSLGPNEHFEATIESLQRQTLQPAEVVICVPKECKPWEVQANGFAVRFVKARRGMITQRAACITSCRTRFLLLLDDDIVLPEDFLATLVAVAVRHEAQCIVPYMPQTLSKGFWVRVLGAVFLNAVPSRKHGVSYLLSGGYKYSLRELDRGQVVETDGGPGAAVFVDRDWVMASGWLGDLSLQRETNPYSLREDSAFVYGLRKRGANVLMAYAGTLVHLGGGTRRDPRRSYWTFEAAIANHFRWWRRFVFANQAGRIKRTLAVGAFAWYVIGMVVTALLQSMRLSSIQPLRGVAAGTRQVFRDLKGDRSRNAL